MSPPASAATNAESANAWSFTLLTLIPLAAAAVSSARTANIRRPVTLRRRLASSSTHPHRTTSTTTPYRSGSVRPSRSRPNSLAPCGTAEPCAPAVNLGLKKTIRSRPIPAPNVTTARFTPRTRNAGRPTRSPTGTAASAPSRIENGKPMPRWLATRTVA